MGKKKVKTSNEQIRETIHERGLTRQQAADLLGVSLHTIHNWLRPESNPEFRKAPHWRAERFVLSTNLRADMQELRAGRDMESED